MSVAGTTTFPTSFPGFSFGGVPGSRSTGNSLSCPVDNTRVAPKPIVDSFRPNPASSAGNLKPTQCIGQMAARVATDTQVNRMMATKGPASATPADASKIRCELSKMDPGVLRALADGGTTIRVLSKNDNLFEAGLLRPIDKAEFSKNQQADRSGIAAAQQTAAKTFDPKIKSAEAVIAQTAAASTKAVNTYGGGGMGFMGANTAQNQNNQAYAVLSDLKMKKEGAIATGIREATDGRWMEFRPGALRSAEGKDKIGGDVPSQMAQQMQMVREQNNEVFSRNASPNQMAQTHGLTDPAQAKAFTDQVYSMNKSRIDSGRQQAVASLTRQAQGTGEKAEQARKILEAFKKDPNSLPISIKPEERPLLVPNMFATTVKEQGKDKQAAMTLHDVGTYHNWSGADGKASNENMLGQYFHENGRSEVIVRREELGKNGDYTLTHELGHGVENILKRGQGKPSGKFDQDLRQSFNTASPYLEPGQSENSNGGGGFINASFGGMRGSGDAKDPDRHAVSYYAETNSHEFFAEGYAAFTHDPERLKATDRKLYDLISQANNTLGAR